MSGPGEHRLPAGWFAATAVASRPYRALAGDLDVDICVVGAGIAGLTAARALAGRGWSVAVLEAGRVGDGGALGNLGLVAAGFCESPERIVARVGLERAKALWALSAEGAEGVRATIAETAMAGVAPVDGLLVVQRVDAAAAWLAQADLLGALGVDADIWPASRVREVLRSERYFQALHRPDAFHIHTLNYALGLAAAAEQAGVRIYEGAQVRAIDAEGVRKRIDTEHGRVRSAHVILAADDPDGRLHPKLRGKTITLYRHMAASAPAPEQLHAAIGFAGVVCDRRSSGIRYRADGDRIVWAGPLTTRQPPRARLRRRAAAHIARLYPQMRGVGMEIVWTASATHAAHRMPLIAALAPGFWFAGAFGDDGTATATMAGDLIARAIAAEDDRWQLFAPYGFSWTGGRLGRAAAALALGATRVRSFWEERFARPAAVPAEPLTAPMPSLVPEPDADGSAGDQGGSAGGEGPAGGEDPGGGEGPSGGDGPTGGEKDKARARARRRKPNPPSPGEVIDAKPKRARSKAAAPRAAKVSASAKPTKRTRGKKKTPAAEADPASARPRPDDGSGR